MRRIGFNALMVLALAASPVAMIGCEETIEEERQVEVKDDGTVVKETEKVTEDADGTITKTEEKKVENP